MECSSLRKELSILKTKKWATDFSMIDEELDNGISNYYSKAYLRHLFIAEKFFKYIPVEFFHGAKRRKYRLNENED